MRFLKTVSDGAAVTLCDRVFDSHEAATGTAWSPIIESWERYCAGHRTEKQLLRICCSFTDRLF